MLTASLRTEYIFSEGFTWAVIASLLKWKLRRCDLIDSPPGEEWKAWKNGKKDKSQKKRFESNLKQPSTFYRFFLKRYKKRMNK